MNERNKSALIVIAVMVVMVGFILYVDEPEKMEERYVVSYLDELRLLHSATWVFNATTAGEALTWALENVNGTDAIIARLGDVYSVGIIV